MTFEIVRTQEDKAKFSRILLYTTRCAGSGYVCKRKGDLNEDV